MPERSPEYIQLTSEELRYVNPNHPDTERFPRRRAYVRGLLNGSYDYSVVARFGDQSVEQSPTERLLWAGVDPTPETTESTVIVLARENETA